MRSVHRARHGFFFYDSVHLAGILSKKFASSDPVYVGYRSGAYLLVFLTLFRAKREISKVCLQIIFGYGSETGLLACVRENTRRYVKIRVGKCFVSGQDSSNMYLRNTREKK